MQIVKIVGAGLAGAEAALQLAKRNIKVELYEMRPHKTTGAHVTSDCAEFVCSNSLGSSDVTNASGLLKKEMEILGGELIKIAKENSVPAGNALAIAREDFSRAVTKKIEENPNIKIIREEVTEIPEGNVIIASGPLTSDTLANEILKFTGCDHLHFFDAIAPIIEKSSINFDKAFYMNRYNKGSKDYINCPMNKEEYERFYNILINAPRIELKTFEKEATIEKAYPNLFVIKYEEDERSVTIDISNKITRGIFLMLSSPPLAEGLMCSIVATAELIRRLAIS